LRILGYLLAVGMVTGAAAAVAAEPTASKTPAAKTEKAPASSSSPQQQPKEGHGARDAAADIVSQPVRDVGLSRKEIPPPLVLASDNPYGLTGLKTCRQLAAALSELNDSLGPDLDGAAYHENRAAKFAQAGGAAVVNSIIPFRSLVREVTGAAPADRRMRAAINAGFARRGYLRGVYSARGCRPKLSDARPPVVAVASGPRGGAVAANRDGPTPAR